MKKTILISLITLFIVNAAGCGGDNNTGEEPQYTEEEMIVIAQCLTDAGVRMYGATWCGHCAHQKETFGEAFQYIDYVECDAHTDPEGARICIEEMIERLPTWEFPDGEREPGTKSVYQLAKRAGCV
jgi:hypothetical protein